MTQRPHFNRFVCGFSGFWGPGAIPLMDIALIVVAFGAAALRLRGSLLGFSGFRASKRMF